MTPRATYRMQFHKGFTFADAAALVPYLDDLGISHLYASPITRAVAGSTHGYDVVDPTVIGEEQGGEAGFRALVAALRARGMGIIIDIVPNHMGVAGDENRWWHDVLAKGQASEFAPLFDIDWRERVLLPVLGEPLEQALASGAIAIDATGDLPVLTAYGEHRFPIREEDHAEARTQPGRDTLAALLDRQHYRLAWWRTANDALNWRRFFTISELAGVRQEDEAVFERTHALYFRLWREGLIDGVRIDHVDGLTDPGGYCRRLRARLDALPRVAGAPPGPALIWVEKILGAGETLARDWRVDGTSGYDFMEEVSGLLHDPAGEAPLGALWAVLSGRPAAFEPEELRARQDMVAWAFDGQLAGTVESFVRLAEDAGQAMTPAMIRRAIERLLWVFPVYRTYGTGATAPAADRAIRQAARRRVERLLPPGEAFVVEAVLQWVAGEGDGDHALKADAVRRFQQLSAPVAAKGVEDTAFYRYGRLLSRNDVGFDAGRFGWSPDAFHAAMRERAAHFPHALLATATHDHKRGEDVRARLSVLSFRANDWAETLRRWIDLAAPHADGIDRGDMAMLFQMLVGAWPDELDPADKEGSALFVDRVAGWQEKSLREAKLRSSWEAPDEDYEGRMRGLLEALLDPARSAALLVEMNAFRQGIARDALDATLVQVALRYTVPGVPDCYQGTELADLSLVDPDNRRPVDYGRRRALLDSGTDAKLVLLKQLLALRREHAAMFAEGDYQPLPASGPGAAHLLGFQRQHGGSSLLCAFALHGSARWSAAQWSDTKLGDVAAADLFRAGPVVVRVGPIPESTSSS